MTLFEFATEEECRRWHAVDDVVMGGISNSSFEPGGESVAVFSGTVSLEHGGGFASARSPSFAYDCEGYDGIELRVLGDGRRYKCRVRTHSESDGIVYQAAVVTVRDAWMDVRIPFADFLPVFRGRAMNDSPPLNLKDVRSVGLLISERQEGAFRLEIDYIRVF